jgi:signal transduction histidine kinase
MKISKPVPKTIASKSTLIRIIVISALITIIIGGGLYYITSLYVLNQAEKNIQNLLLSHRGIHEYAQKVMHPALYGFKDDSRIPHEFYSPELFSSTFMVRNQHIYYNQARVEAGLPPVYYKMAAKNPRNPVNKADPLEERLIEMFNQEREVRKYREIVEIDGEKFLYVAMPFLDNQPRCMVCHGKREEAPIQLQEIYAGQGGFNESLGEIRAIESIRAPMEQEYFTVYIISAALVCGVIAILALFQFNQRMRSIVSDKTIDLEKEIKERIDAENRIRELNASLEKRVEQRTVQLEAANKELDSFAYSVSHDLRAPLRGIDGFSLALVEDYNAQLDETGKNYIGRIRSACSRMGTLIDDLLQMSRMTRCEVNRSEVNLSEVACSILEELKQGEQARQIKFTAQKDITVHADPTLIRAVMANLIGNAWKFTRENENAIIEFGSVRKKGKEVFFVKDNGVGFDMAYANKLFNAFQRLHSANQFEGTGIGLATVQRIVNRHGGRIWGEAEVDKGATFYFTI